MDECNVQSLRGVTLVGGGAPKADDIRELLALAPDLVAADGGANTCVSYGFRPLAAIGDFDSLAQDTRDALPETRFLHVTEQDTTDFEKSLTRIDAPFILATGFTSGRIDHTLASLSALAQHVGPPLLVLGERDVIFAAPPSLSLDIGAEQRLSLFPMVRVTGRSKGLKWPIDGLTLDPAGQVGTSNRTTGPVTLEFDAPGCLVILQRAALVPALRALTG